MASIRVRKRELEKEEKFGAHDQDTRPEEQQERVNNSVSESVTPVKTQSFMRAPPFSTEDIILFNTKRVFPLTVK